MSPKTDAGPPKPRLALAVATAFGLGYLPKAPGTFGSLAGVFLTWAASTQRAFPTIVAALAIVVSLVGFWAAARVATHLRTKDPPIVVVDEVAGQLIAYLGLAAHAASPLNWKYLLAGFILFRVFDIWKPFPARRAEALPGALGILADDWIAGLYAALALWLARQLGL